MFLEISIETFNSRVNIILKLHAETTKLDFKKALRAVLQSPEAERCCTRI